MAKMKKATSSRSEDLEAAVFAAPDSDAPRLVYADWLQSQGDPRGELAMVQSALSTARGPEWAKLKVKERALFETHAKALYGPLVKWKRARLAGLDGIREDEFHDEDALRLRASCGGSRASPNSAN